MQDTFTYQEIMEAYGAAQQLSMIAIPQKTAYRLSRLLDRLTTCFKQITKEKIELVKKYGVEEKPGSGGYKIPDEKKAEFEKIWETFCEQTMDIEYMPIACNMFPSLPAACILGMGKFMIEEEKILTR